MKKIVNFIIEKKYIILTLFIAAAIASLYLSSKVVINYDISEYLPESSEVKQGLNIMNDEFEEKTTSFRLMFSNLTSEEQKKIKSEIESKEYVKEVLFDEKDDKQLFTITLDGNKESKEANETYKKIIEEYKDYETLKDGDIVSRNTEVITTFVLVAAIGFGAIILIVMCDSVLEVFLFLFTILIAVLFNKGTNIFFKNVSNITDSISAILQLALSMDYSIILMNRYNQEKKRIKENKEAMKEALYHAFSSIASSSITTVVGLLALIFMSFTIGRDMGFVLAKGVLCSLISTFFVLPGLILIFDKGIQKTKKKSPSIKMNKIASFSYKYRYIFLVLFLIIFVGSYLLRGNLGIYYIDDSKKDINEYFKSENEIAVIYNKKDEDIISKYCKSLENNKKINNVICYGNTLNEKLKYNEINNKLNDLSLETTIDDYLLKLVYYKYNTNEDNKLGYNDLIKFVKEVIYKNNDIEITSNQISEVNHLSYFTSKDSINKNRTIEELSNILGIDKKKLKELIILYNSNNTNTNISLKDFIIFMNNNVINDSSYEISNSTKNDIKKLYNIIINIDSNKTSTELSNMLGIDNNQTIKVLLFYLNSKEINTKLSIYGFTNTIINNYDSYKEYFELELIEKVKLLNKFSNKDLISSELPPSNLSMIFDLDEMIVNSILLSQEKEKCSPYEFSYILINSGLITDQETLTKLNMINQIMSFTINNETFDYNEISTILGIDNSKAKLVYALHDLPSTTITPRIFINIIVNNNIVDNQEIKKLYAIINNLNNKYSYDKISSLLGIDSSQTKLIYGLYDYTSGKTTISLSKLIDFICNKVMNNSKYSSNFDQKTKNKINGINQIISSVNKNEKLTSQKMINTLSLLDEDIDKNAIEIIYIYYGSTYEYNDAWSMTIEELVKYLNEDILNDKRFDNYIKEDMKKEIKDSKTDVNEALDMLVGNKYSRMIITSNMNVESKEVESLINDIKENIKDAENYVIGDSPMAIEMNKTFNDELNLITILTMSFIFVVVAITFKSITVPIILVLTIQSAVYATMGILSLIGGTVYFISLLVVQAVLMGATIDYAIVYTSYYIEHRKTLDIMKSVTESYNKSIHTIITSSLILCSCTLIVALLTTSSSARICETIAEGAFCATILIIFVLPGVIASLDKLIKKK